MRVEIEQRFKVKRIILPTKDKSNIDWYKINIIYI
jgi:hypothetical protein